MKIMKQYFKIALASLAVFAFAGCSSLMEDENMSNSNEVRFTANLAQFETKAFTEPYFEAGDAFGIIAMEPLNVTNAKYTYDGKNLTSDTPICWPEGYDKEIYFASYYPYDPEFSMLNEYGYTIRVKTDQSTYENYRASDFLVADIDARPGETVELEYEHFLSRIDVSIPSEYEGKVASVAVSGVYAEINVGSESKGDPVSIKAGELALKDGSTVWSVIVIPAGAVRPDIELSFKDGSTQRVSVTRSMDLQDGKRYHAVISANEDGSLVAEFVTRIFDWMDGDWVYVEPVSKGWYICGDFTNWDAKEAIQMQDNGKGIYNLAINLPAYAQFKFIYGKVWDVNLGGTEKGTYADYCTPEIAPGQTVYLQSGGYNLLYAPGGEVSIYLDTNSNIAWIEAAEAPPSGPKNWSVIGSLYGDSWSVDIPMFPCYEDDGYYALIYYEEGQEFKLRANGTWDENRGIDGGNGYGGHYALPNGPNITLPETGLYEVFFYDKDQYIYIAKYEEEGSWGLTGSLMNLAWTDDLPISRYVVGKYGPVLIFEAECNEGDEFKFRFQHNWFFNFGLAEWSGAAIVPGNEYSLVQDGANIKIPAAGKYSIEFSLYGSTVAIYN